MPRLSAQAAVPLWRALACIEEPASQALKGASRVEQLSVPWQLFGMFDTSSSSNKRRLGAEEASHLPELGGRESSCALAVPSYCASGVAEQSGAAKRRRLDEVCYGEPSAEKFWHAFWRR